MSLPILYLSDNTLVVILTDNTGAKVESATGTVTIVHKAAPQASVDGVTWPEDLTETAADDLILSDGTVVNFVTYRYEIPYDLLAVGRYFARVTFTSPGRRYAEIELNVKTDND